MDVPRILDPRHVEAALHSDRLVPPAAPPSIGNGATADLRAAMARFSSGDDHLHRRSLVEIAVEAIADLDVATIAESAAQRRLNARTIDALADVGSIVPTHALGAALGVRADDLNALAHEVRSIVEVLGRSGPATAESDEAATQLRRRFVHHPGGADANISLLYQNHDATAALFASRLLARDESKRRGALAKTVRFVATGVELAGRWLEPGTLVELSLDDPALEFGAGIHRCPGSELAGSIVDGMLDALSDWAIVRGDIEYDADGRPLNVPMIRST